MRILLTGIVFALISQASGAQQLTPAEKLKELGRLNKLVGSVSIEKVVKGQRATAELVNSWTATEFYELQQYICEDAAKQRNREQAYLRCDHPGWITSYFLKSLAPGTLYMEDGEFNRLLAMISDTKEKWTWRVSLMSTISTWPVSVSQAQRMVETGFAVLDDPAEYEEMCIAAIRLIVGGIQSAYIDIMLEDEAVRRSSGKDVKEWFKRSGITFGWDRIGEIGILTEIDSNAASKETRTRVDAWREPTKKLLDAAQKLPQAGRQRLFSEPRANRDWRTRKAYIEVRLSMTGLLPEDFTKGQKGVQGLSKSPTEK